MADEDSAKIVVYFVSVFVCLYKVYICINVDKCSLAWIEIAVYGIVAIIVKYREKDIYSFSFKRIRYLIEASLVEPRKKREEMNKDKYREKSGAQNT